MPDFSHATHGDLRKTLSTGAKYREYWENKIHPIVVGSHLVTDRFASAINRL